MILFKKSNDLHNWLESQRKNRNKIGFAPTMGALHEGHISLIRAAGKENTVTVSSIFVNPTQFNDPKDFEKYPVTIEKDIQMLEEAGCDILFLPSVNEIYPDGLQLKKHYDLGYLETVLEGKFRPGHFQGVCMVVHRLLDIVKPDNLYLGQKDYQQCMVIKKLIELTGMKDKVQLNISSTLREKDGLAMSSRNVRLNESERKTATTIFQCLSMIREKIQPGKLDKLIEEGHAMLVNAGFKPDYVEIADANDLSPIRDWNGQQKPVALIAAFLNEVRLIDNMVIL